MSLPGAQIIDQVLILATQIQAIPSLTFQEEQRSNYIYYQFATLGLSQIERDEFGNVFGMIKGGHRPPLIISAHLDSVLSPEGQPIHITETSLCGPGIADNALGLAALLSTATLLKNTQNLAGNIWLVANVCEEGLGNLLGMKEVVNRFGAEVSAYLVLEGIGLGFIQTGALGNHRMSIEVTTKGGHSWNNFGDPSAIHILAKIAARITRIRMPDKPRCSFNIGEIHGGDSINTIASQAKMLLEIRSEDAETLEGLTKRIHRLIKRKKFSGSTIRVQEIGSRPSGRISDSHPLILAAKKALELQNITPILSITSSDASLPISMGYPATCIGVTTGKNVHTVQETIDIAPIMKGLNQIQEIIRHIWSP